MTDKRKMSPCGRHDKDYWIAWYPDDLMVTRGGASSQAMTNKNRTLPQSLPRGRNRGVNDLPWYQKLAHQGAAGDDAVDLVGAFINLRKLGVTHQFLHHVFFDIPVSAVNLNGIGG